MSKTGAMRIAAPIGSLLLWANLGAVSPARAQRTYPGVPAADIPDNTCEDDVNGTGDGGISHQIIVPAIGTLSDVNIAIQVDHTFRSDLQIGVTYIPLIGGPVGPITLANSHDAGDDNYYATFDSDAATPCGDSSLCGGGMPVCQTAPGPSCSPDSSLDVFNGATAPGLFHLSVCDRLAQDLGTVRRWSVTATGLQPTLDIDLDGTVGALTDGLLMLRYAFGLRGDPLVTGAVSGSCGRCTGTQVEAYMRSLIDHP